jgi:acyl phosphate:glycerol-3-phosphate acyltransferase
MSFFTIIHFIIAFSIGSIPFGIIICKSLGLASPKTYGSKNIGASNVARQNLLAGILTLALDAAKGFLALKLLPGHDSLILAVVLGHCFSPLLNFRGGKGVATTSGALFASTPSTAVVLLSLWGVTYMRKKTPAISSLVCSAMLLLYAAMQHNPWLAATSIIVIIRHTTNVQKLRTA